MSHRTLVTKHYDHDSTIDWNTGQTIRGADAVLEAFVAQLGAAKQAGIAEMGGVPTLMGEFGIPFDLDNKAAYLSGDFSTHIAALDATLNLRGRIARDNWIAAAKQLTEGQAA
jgi:hypothetical protein